jgi:hypothetical protein
MALSARSRARMPGAGAMAAGRVAARCASLLRGWLTVRWQRAVRSRAVPAELRAQLALCRGELVLAVGYGHDGNCALIATDRALHHRTGRGAWSRLGWELMTGLAWDAAGGRLFITAMAGTAPLPAPVPLRDCGPLLELAEERITHTRLGCWTVLLDGQRRVLAEARRRPVTGELLWIVSPRDGIDLSDRHARRQIGIAVTRLRDELGIAHLSSGGHAPGWQGQ